MREYVTETEGGEVVYSGDSLQKAAQTAIDQAPARIFGHGSRWAQQLGSIRPLQGQGVDLLAFGPESTPEVEYQFRELLT